MQFLSKRSTLLFLFLCLSAVSSSCAATSGNRVSSSSSPEPTPQTENKQAEVKSPLPAPTGWVNDYANVFKPESKTRLESELTELKNVFDIEFAVATVETTGGQSIFDYSLAVAKGWGIGPKDTSKGGGLLLMVATKDRQWRLQVSRSLEKDLPDEVTKKLGDQSLPFYRQGRYEEGIIKYVEAIVERLEEVRRFKLSDKNNFRKPSHGD